MLIAAIPVRNQLRWTAPLVEGLLLADDVDAVWVYDNGSTDDTATWVTHRSVLDPRLILVPAHGARLYGMWNDMIARSPEGAHLAILNNDIRLPHNALRTMSSGMSGYEIAVVNTARSSFEPVDTSAPIEEVTWRQRVGWAFMVRTDFWLGQEYAVHPDFKIWWGDDDLFLRAQQRGARIARFSGVGANHLEQSSSGEYPGNYIADIEADRATFARVWPGMS